MQEKILERWSKCCVALAHEDYVEMEVGDDVQAFYWECSQCKKPCTIYKPERPVDHDMKLISHIEGYRELRNPTFDFLEKIPWVKEVWECARCAKTSSTDQIVSYCTTEVFDPSTTSYQLILPSCALR